MFLMQITAVQNIPFAVEAFSEFGQVTIIPDKELVPGRVDETDILLVRSTMPINENLLKNSRVAFVGTATIGFDHVDRDYLASREIAFASAPGSNANSVSEYVTAALLELANKHGFLLREKTLGIVGHGNVGKRVFKKAEALGMTIVVNDPPLEDETGDSFYRPLEEILEADIVTVHVPLTREGPDPTWHLIDDSFLARLKQGAILLNSSRGAVSDTTALRRSLESGSLTDVVLDVWEGEPNIDLDLRDMAFIATHHIAGHSFDGKVNGTRMLYEAVCQRFGAASSWDPTPLLPPAPCPSIEIGEHGPNLHQESLRQVVREVYDIWQDHRDLEGIKGLPEKERGPHFKKLRKEYPIRREFYNTRVYCNGSRSDLRSALQSLGFSVDGSVAKVG